jgi:hypothetical protein
MLKLLKEEVCYFSLRLSVSVFRFVFFSSVGLVKHFSFVPDRDRPKKNSSFLVQRDRRTNETQNRGDQLEFIFAFPLQRTECPMVKIQVRHDGKSFDFDLNPADGGAAAIQSISRCLRISHERMKLSTSCPAPVVVLIAWFRHTQQLRKEKF